VGVKPDWFFLWVYQILKWIPTYVLGIEGEVVGITGLAMAAVVIFCAPFVDWKSQRNERSPLFTAFAVVSLLVFLVCTAIGFFF
jgi:cytochrome b6